MAEMPPAEGQTPKKEGKYFLLLPDKRGTHSIIPSFMQQSCAEHPLTPGTLLRVKRQGWVAGPSPRAPGGPPPRPPPPMGSALFLPLSMLIMHHSGLCPTCLILTYK